MNRTDPSEARQWDVMALIESFAQTAAAENDSKSLGESVAAAVTAPREPRDIEAWESEGGAKG